MADFAPQFIADIHTIIAAAWTDVADSKQRFTASQALEFNILQIIGGILEETDDDDLAAPFAVIEVGKYANEKDLGIAQAKLYRTPVAIWYVDLKRVRTADISDQQFVHAKLYALKERFAGYPFDSFTTLSEANMDSSHSCVINNEARHQQYSVCGGVIWWDEGIITGEHFTTAP